MTTENLRIEQQGPVTKVWFDDIKAGWEQRLLLRSDVHYDSVHCNRSLEAKHLKEAQETDSLILDIGDLIDGMQGRYDPRRSYNDLRPEYLGENYLDRIQNDLEEHYAPYAKNWLLLARGNHESTILKNNSTDISSNLARHLNRIGGKVAAGKYGGWVVMYFSHKGSNKSSLKIKYFHGAGGEAPVTRGAIQTNRQMVYLPDADIIWNGHNHHEYIMTVKRERMSPLGDVYFDICRHIRTPGYHNAYGEGEEGWEVERGMVPKPQGCAWVNLKCGTDGRVDIRAVSDVE